MDNFPGSGVVALACCILWATWLIALSLQRLYFSPIANFPGPKLAALTFWYEFYFDVIKNGQYTFEIRRMHQKYGPIIRINPHELHVETPDFYDEVFAGPGKIRNRWAWSTTHFGIPESVFGTLDHNTHRIRRAAIQPFFSKRSVRSLQPIIDERIDKFMQRFVDFYESGETMTISLGFAAFTNDIVMEYAFARSEHRVEQKDFDPSFHDASVAGSSMGAVTKQFPWIFPIMQSMPDRLATWMDPNMASYVNLQRGIQEQISQIRNGSNRNWKDVSHPTIFHEILESDLPDAEKSTTRLWQDGQITVLAGTLTTAWTLSVAMFHLLFQADVLRKLKTELKSAISHPTSKVPLLTLEQLPYLTACIKESLRLSYGVSSRLQRICPNEALIFNDGKKDWKIPPGTPVGMTCALIHHDPDIFPDSHAFNPERWINQPHLDRYLVSFCKGTRQCLGINLAYAELYLLLARIFRSYGSDKVSFEDDLGYLELYETTVADVELVADHFIPLPQAGSKGIRIRVLNDGQPL